jgi:Glyoxalase/Bleomycin resistance protein/Dioxygenase superfamily
VLHHVTLEISPTELGRAGEFWALLGFSQVEPPDDLAARFTWFERDGTQVHLMHVDAPEQTPHGHTAVVVPDFAAATERLEESGFEIAPKRERWGSPRAEAIAPGGHRVELMASPPG